MTDDGSLDVLLVEDNPGDVRLIEEMLHDFEALLRRFDGEFSGETKLHTEETLAAGLERLDAVDVDLVLLDLGLPDSMGLDTLTAVTDATEFVPVVVLTGLSDEAVGIRAIQEGAQDYLVKDDVNSDLLVRSIHHALERNRQERDRARRREQLEALNRLNEISQDVTHAVITTSTRTELEQAVCDRLVDAEDYRFAWIGEVERGRNRVTARASAGVGEGYLDAVTITVDGSETARGPTGRAIHTREPQVMRDTRTDPAYGPWREAAAERGYRSSASVPIAHGDIQYGVLNVYATSPNAFSDAETEILARLGDVIGHAITAIERKEALVSDTVLELEFRAEDHATDVVALTDADGCRVDVDDVIRTSESVLAYGRAVGTGAAPVSEALADASLVDEFRILSAGEDAVEFEAVAAALTPLVDAVATHGGQVASATAADGALRFVVEFPPGRDRRQLIELVGEHCPRAENLAQRLVDRGADTAPQGDSVLHDSLTEKQRTALQTAYSAGLFEWPRTSTGQELAERLGVSPPTFNQRLRAAERKVFDAVLSEGKGDVSDPDE